MTTLDEECEGLWRASSTEAMPYTDDFPESILITPELIDGSVSSQGNATIVKIQYKWIPDTTLIEFCLEDNGQGVRNTTRLLSWAAANLSDNIHRNGHGLKKALTKYMPNWRTAKWEISYRRKGMQIITHKGPFRKHSTETNEDEEDTTHLMPSGTRIRFTFESSVLGKYNSPIALLHALREIITTRYNEDTLRRINFQLTIVKDKQTLQKSSHTDVWHSFQWHLEQACTNQNPDKKPIAVKKIEFKEAVEGGTYTYTEYHIDVNGKSSYHLKKDEYFPVYAKKSMSSSRNHIALGDRMIEAYPFYKLFGREAPHNDYNGMISFTTFLPTSSDTLSQLPIPATTKVSFYENNEAFRKYTATLSKRREFHIAESLKKKKDVPVEKPVVKVAVKTGDSPQTSTASSIASSRSNSVVSSVSSASSIKPPSKPNTASSKAVAPAPAPTPSLTQTTQVSNPLIPLPKSDVHSVIPVSSHTRTPSKSQKDILTTIETLKEILNRVDLNELMSKSSNECESGLVDVHKSATKLIDYVKSLTS